MLPLTPPTKVPYVLHRPVELVTQLVVSAALLNNHFTSQQTDLFSVGFFYMTSIDRFAIRGFMADSRLRSVNPVNEVAALAWLRLAPITAENLR